MAERKDFFYDSCVPGQRIHGVSWAPDGEMKGAVQLIHGMAEYVMRYDAFARLLAGAGFLVVGNDHLGHGESAASDADLGYIGTKKPEDALLRDCRALTEKTRREHPGLPCFILGHSMGSYILRSYLIKYPNAGLSGAVIMGTGYVSAAVTGAALFLDGLIGVFRGGRFKSGFIKKLAMGSYNDRIPDAKTENDWLSTDAANVERYNADPRCGFMFTLNGYKALFRTVRFSCSAKNAGETPKEVPILLVSGAEDPVGNYGAGVEKVRGLMNDAGVRDVEMKLYAGCRHEILNDVSREECGGDVLAWIERHAAGEG